MVLGVLLQAWVIGLVEQREIDDRQVGERAVEGADTVAQVQSAFDRYAAIDDIKSVTGRDLEIEPDRSGKSAKFIASFRYERRIELFGPASLLLAYRGSTAER